MIIIDISTGLKMRLLIYCAPALFALIPLIKALIENFKNWSYINSLVDEQSVRDFNAFKDKRKPILYLRSFSVDGILNIPKSISIPEIPILKYQPSVFFPTDGLSFNITYENFEYSLAESVKNIGPFFAIGKPFDDFGATRIPFSDLKWKAGVSKTMENAIIIVMRISQIEGSGVSWELKQLMKKHLKKTIFLVEYSKIELNSQKKDNRSIFETHLIKKFKIKLKDVFPNDSLNQTRFLEFLDNGELFISDHIEQTNIFKNCSYL